MADAGVEVSELSADAAAEFAELLLPCTTSSPDELTPELIEAFTQRHSG